MEEQAVLSGDNAFNAHFGECITGIGDIDDDGYQGQFSSFAAEEFWIQQQMFKSLNLRCSNADTLFSTHFVCVWKVELLFYSKKKFTYAL